MKLLQQLTAGFDLVTVGNSAGGYMASLMGYLLNADRIFCFSGQFILDEKANGPIMDYYRNKDQYNKYFDVKKYINSKTKLFYFCPAKVEKDWFQYKYMCDSENFFPFLYDSSVHGKTIKGIDYPLVFRISDDYLCRCSQKNKEKLIDSEQFAKDIEPILYPLYIFIGNCFRKILCLLLNKMRFL